MDSKVNANREKAAVLVDSGCDIAQECLDKFGMWLLPLHIDYEEKAYLDGVDIDPQMVYDRYPKDYPKTSTPSLQEVIDKLDEMADAGIEKVIAVCISSGLSGTWNAVRLAALHQERVEVFVFDTKNISVASGLLGIWAARKLAEGMSYADVCQGLQDRIYESKVMFYMDTLEYLKRGGRIGTVSSMIGQALKIKPIISCNKEGIYYTVSLIRGSRKGKEKLLKEMVKFCGDHHVWLGIGHGDADKESEEMEKMILEALGGRAEVMYRKQIAATLALNTGPGLVGVAAILDP
ncbi:MAG: DegV family protein [Lachnospiraceae bacterium]|nr:DegV family protein [Lachnospiraceae bacterium]MDO4407678.1 DegV family protein [Eubacteriales bacterium]